MPCSHTIDMAKGWVYVKLRAPMVPGEMDEHLRLLISSRELPNPYRQLVDMRDVEAFQLSTDEARHVIAVLTQRAEIRNGRLAFVAARPAVYGMCRVFAAFAQGALKVGVFSEPSVAEAYLFRG